MPDEAGGDATAEVAEQADATVSKTVDPRGSCRFDPGLRHRSFPMHAIHSFGGSLMVEHRSLEPVMEVRFLPPEPTTRHAR